MLRRVLAVPLLIGVLFSNAPPARADVLAPADCLHPQVPGNFRDTLITAIRASGNLRIGWANDEYIPRIICWQQTGFRTDFRANGYKQRWIGVFAMTVREMKTIKGPWLSNDRHELILSPTCFVRGWDACPHTTANTRSTQQLIAGLRWIWLLYGEPRRAWRNIVRTGRFNSYPRAQADVTPTHEPFRICPVRRPVNYEDDFGEVRPVGGFHRHNGNDIETPTGRPIRAPFDGLVVAHADDWFAGRYVTVVGREGYARNSHLSRFGALGRVTTGTIIGYVGETGDALRPHDHFSYHPWNVPKFLHVSPLGFARITDAIDPYPHLNKVCRG